MKMILLLLTTIRIENLLKQFKRNKKKTKVISYIIMHDLHKKNKLILLLNYNFR